METVLVIGVSILVGLAVGILSGLLGVGGGTMLVPVFKLVYGMQAIAATATSLFTIIPTSLTGAISHIRNRTCIPLLGVAAGIGGACTSPVGVWLASLSPEWAIMVAAALVIGYSAITMFRKAAKLRRKKAAKASEKAKGADAKAEAGDSGFEGRIETLDDFKKRIPARRQIIVGALVGLFAGVISGYVGVGGGFIMIPMFMQLLGTPMKLTSGTSLIAVMAIAVPGTVAQAMLGNVDWLAGIFIACGTIPGAAIGAKLMPRVSELALRFGFSIFLLVAAVLLVLNQLGVF